MTKAEQSESLQSSGFGLSSKADQLAMAIILLLHITASCVFLPPWEALRQEPLYDVDYPVNTHRVYLYRQGLLESGLPWGYDPAVSAGVFMTPKQDTGAKPLQVLSLLLPFLSPGAVVRLFSFVAVLTFPLWTLLACRRLGLPFHIQLWVMVALIGRAWLLDRYIVYFYMGLVGFATASYFSIYVLVLFLDFLAKPGWKIYVAFCFAATLLWLLHIVGPVAIIPPLVLYTLFARSLTLRWRIAAILVPLVVVICNGFWFVPFWLTEKISWPPWPVIPALVTGDTHQTFDSWSEFVTRALDPQLIGTELLAFSLAIYGFTILQKQTNRRVAVSFALTVCFSFFLTTAGSFLPVLVNMQPGRFILPLFVLLNVPVGIALAELAKKIQLPMGLSAAGFAVLLLGIAIMTGRPRSLPLPPAPNPLGDFIDRHTAPTDRLLIQSLHGYGLNYYEPKIFPLVYGREVIGCTYPMVYDPAQFLGPTLWGKELHTWSPEDLRLTLERWGVAWAFTVTQEAQSLLAATTNQPGEMVGKYHAFRVPGLHTRFLVGQGHVVAAVNRFELTQLRPENGLIVLRYRYHPAWETSSNVSVEQYPLPEDPVGFIALRSPPESVTLTFNPWKMLRTAWP